MLKVKTAVDKIQDKIQDKMIAMLRHVNPPPAYIGRVHKGFDFLGYRILSNSLAIANTSFARLSQNISRLYEQQASPARLGEYLRNWLRWAKGGVDNLINPIIYKRKSIDNTNINHNINHKINHKRTININIIPDPSEPLKVVVSNDKCFVWV